MLGDVDAATRAMGLQIQVVNANTGREIDAALSTFSRERPDALFVSGGPFLLSRRVQLALLAARYAIPASYGSREYVEIGGLMSYGTSLRDAYRQAGVYTGRILKGEQPTTFLSFSQPSSSLSSTSQRLGRLVSMCRQCYSRRPTR
jgi:putative tryptophan/tyrosine transport system substrate-binding protein